MQIKIKYKPRQWAKILHSSDKQWKIVVAHRRCGKTVACVNHLIRDALLTPKSRFAYIAPTYKQAKNVAWDLVKEYARQIPHTKFNEAELRADFPNGSRITLYGAENVDALRGIALWGVVFDEYSQQPHNIFSEVVSKCLADHNGYAIWIGTPKGKNDFYRLFQKAKLSDAWLAIQRTIDESLKDEEGEVIDNLRKALEADRVMVKDGIMGKDEFEQEWYCNFEAAIKGAYYAEEVYEARQNGRITNVPYDKRVPVRTWWDLGMHDSTAIGFFQRVGREWHMIDYYEASGEGLAHYAEVLRKKSEDMGYIYDGHYAPHDIVNKEIGTGLTRLEMARQLGINFAIVRKIGVQDGITAARARFATVYFDEKKCDRFIEAISQYRKEYNDKMGDFKDRPLHDWTSHAADMFRYWAVTPEPNNTVRNQIYTYPKESF